jgi:hypothetical protein
LLPGIQGIQRFMRNLKRRLSRIRYLMLQVTKSLSIVRDVQCQIQERVGFDRLLIGLSCGAIERERTVR